MFRHLNIVSALQGLRFTPNSASNINVRWRRKPRWLPVAPSKKFRVPVRPQIPEDETKELLRLNNFYRTQMRGIRRMLLEDIRQAEVRTKSLQQGSDSEVAEHARCMAINDAWNKSIIPIREARVAQQAKERAERALIGMSIHERVKQEKAREIEAFVLAEKELSSTYITPDKLDAAIEEALANPVDHNYAIDLEGNIAHGRVGQFTPEETPSRTSV